MRVALIHHQYQLKGGMETYLRDLVSGFNAYEDEVTAYVYKHTHDPSMPACCIKKSKLNWLPRSLRKYWFAHWLSKKSELDDFDLSLSLMRSLKQNMIICGGTHKGFLRHVNKTPRFLDKIEILFETKAYAVSNTIIAHSELLRNELINLYRVPSEKIVKLHPPLDTDTFHTGYRNDRDSLRTKFNIDPAKFAVLFPSTGHKRKGFSLLVDAFNKLPSEDFQLIVAGTQPPIQNSNIHYVGFVKNIAQLYAACDVTALPSYYEPFGLVVTESLACGTPVIVSQYVGAKDLITEKHGLVLDELSSKDIAQKIVLAKEKKFFIEPDFPSKNNLTLSHHIQAIKNAHKIFRKCTL